MWKILQKKQAAYVKEQLLMEDGTTPNLTLVHDCSSWGEKWKGGKQPVFDGIQDVTKHVTSLGTLSLKGFVKVTLPHSSHFAPHDLEDPWFAQLLKALCSPEDSVRGYIQWTKMLEYGCSTSTFKKLGSNEDRLQGQYLLKLLMAMDRSGFENGAFVGNDNEEGDQEDIPLSPLYITVLSFMATEKGRYERDEFILETKNLTLKIKGKCVIREDGRSEKDDFSRAELVERMIVDFCLIDCTKENKNRVALIPQLIKFVGGRNKMESLCRIFLAIAADIFQLIYALSIDDQDQKLLKILGDEANNFAMTTANKMILRKRLGCFLECILPVYGYLAFCRSVEGQRALKYESIRELVVKAQKTKRVVIKNTKEKLWKLLPSCAGEQMSLKMDSSLLVDNEIRANKNNFRKAMEAGENCIVEIDVSHVLSEDLVNGIPDDLLMTLNRFESMEIEEPSDSDELESLFAESLMEETLKENEISTEEEQHENMLSFAGSLAWLDGKEPSSNGKQTSAINKFSPNDPKNDSIRLTEEHKSVILEIIEESEDEDDKEFVAHDHLNRSKASNVSTGSMTPASTGESHDSPLSSTKISAPLTRRNIFLADLSIVPVVDNFEETVDEAVSTVPMTLNVEAEDKEAETRAIVPRFLPIETPTTTGISGPDRRPNLGKSPKLSVVPFRTVEEEDGAVVNIDDETGEATEDFVKEDNGRDKVVENLEAAEGDNLNAVVEKDVTVKTKTDTLLDEVFEFLNIGDVTMKQKLREYALKTPKDVTEETWLGLLDLTLKEIKNGQLKKMKESDRKFALAVAIAKTVIRIGAEFLQKKQIEPSCLSKISKEEGKAYPAAPIRGKYMYLKEKVDSVKRRPFLLRLFTHVVKNEVDADKLTQQYIDECKMNVTGKGKTNVN